MIPGPALTLETGFARPSAWSELRFELEAGSPREGRETNLSDSFALPRRPDSDAHTAGGGARPPARRPLWRMRRLMRVALIKPGRTAISRGTSMSYH